ncbi:MAG: hypothetical protein ACHQDY_09595 [Solirubrobacterales bacterium]
MLERSAILAVLLLALAPVIAPAAPLDAASTHAYIRANFAFAQASEARQGVAQAGAVHMIERFGRECRDAGAGSPQNEEAQKLSYEVAGALWSATYGADAGPIGVFVRAVGPLRWSNPTLTRRAHAYAKSLHELATLPVPDLCGDVHAWRASGFQTIPATTARFDRHVESIEGHTIAPRLLAPYERPSDRGILERTTRLETKLEHAETITGFDDWDSLLETLGLNQ